MCAADSIQEGNGYWKDDKNNPNSTNDFLAEPLGKTNLYNNFPHNILKAWRIRSGNLSPFIFTESL